MVVMLVVLVALGTIAGLTVISVQGGSAQVSAQRFSAMALYAAESGAAAAVSWLKIQPMADDRFLSVLARPPEGIPGNHVKPGGDGNLLSIDQQGWYDVTLRNNAADPGGPTTDTDGTVVIEVTGHGPNGAMKRLEAEVHVYLDIGARKAVIAGWRDVF
jgi:type II secretory pathway pseudopilin PulG